MLGQPGNPNTPKIPAINPGRTPITETPVKAIRETKAKVRVRGPVKAKAAAKEPEKAKGKAPVKVREPGKAKVKADKDKEPVPGSETAPPTKGPTRETMGLPVKQAAIRSEIQMLRQFMNGSMHRNGWAMAATLPMYRDRIQEMVR